MSHRFEVEFEPAEGLGYLCYCVILFGAGVALDAAWFSDSSIAAGVTFAWLQF